MGSSGAGKSDSRAEIRIALLYSSLLMMTSYIYGRRQDDFGAYRDGRQSQMFCMAMIVTLGESASNLVSRQQMDVLAMRKSTGVIEGEIRLNGHPQEENSFRRNMGYVVQFDQQSPQLTIRETCDFSAKLRLDEGDAAVTPESTAKFVEQTLDMLELTSIQDLQVGSDETGGLSFEQRKRLSIAVELVANPSILFLDE